MTIAIIATKPAIAKSMWPVFQARWPNETLVCPMILLRGFYHLPWPRGRAWSAYPLLEDTRERARYQVRAFSDAWDIPPLFHSEPGKAPTLIRDQTRYEESLRTAREVWSWVDVTPSESWAAHVLHQRFAPDTPFYAVCSHTLLKSEVAHDFERARHEDRQWFDALVNEGEVKVYFDHNFAINSVAILGKTFRQPNGHQPWVSKYQLQALYALAKEPQSLTAADWMERFRTWPGTGRYTHEAAGEWFQGLGGTTSRFSILKQLMEHGWVEKVKTHDRLRVTPLGHRAVAVLHPRCEDVDLPFRLNEWAQQGLRGAKPAIDRYLRTFFGRQKRYLDGVSSSPTDGGRVQSGRS